MLEYDFQRGNLIRHMANRGYYIQNLKFAKRRDEEARINKFLLRSKNILENPVRVFVTFEFTEGHNLFI